jgi:riboflavin synthase
MFTGLVVERGRLLTPPAATAAGGVELHIGLSAELAGRLAIGASLAVAGVCLTVTALEETGSGPSVRVELGPETLRRTHLGQLAAGSEVNLEPALRLGDALGGHWVQGHVDGLLTVRQIERVAVSPIAGASAEEHWEVTFALPPALADGVVEKGSVALDGVSLTVARVLPDAFVVALIPHTLAVTTLGSLVVGQALDYEADVLGKYVARLVSRLLPGPPSTAT